MAIPYDLYCVVNGSTSWQAICISYKDGFGVFDLKCAIKAAMTPEFDNIPASRLTLWQINYPITEENRSSPIKLYSQADKRLMHPMESINSSRFPPYPQAVQVIVSLTEPPPTKQPPPYELDSKARMVN